MSRSHETGACARACGNADWPSSPGDGQSCAACSAGNTRPGGQEKLGGSRMTTVARTSPELNYSRRPSVHALDVQKIRSDFPLLQQRIRGKELVYLDNA